MSMPLDPGVQSSRIGTSSPTNRRVPEAEELAISGGICASPGWVLTVSPGRIRDS
jgi:hypothetical protein